MIAVLKCIADSSEKGGEHLLLNFQRAWQPVSLQTLWCNPKWTHLFSHQVIRGSAPSWASRLIGTFAKGPSTPPETTARVVVHQNYT